MLDDDIVKVLVAAVSLIFVAKHAVAEPPHRVYPVTVGYFVIAAGYYPAA